jgi:hypothetical protein
MANVRTIAREIAPAVGLTPRQTEKVIHTYLLVLSTAAKSGVRLGRLGTLEWLEYLEGLVGSDPLRFTASQGLIRAAKRQTLPPRVAERIGRA